MPAATIYVADAVAGSRGRPQNGLGQSWPPLAGLGQQDRDWIFAKTAQTLYPALTD
jgi:hypothetical protein